MHLITWFSAAPIEEQIALALIAVALATAALRVLVKAAVGSGKDLPPARYLQGDYWVRRARRRYRLMQQLMRSEPL
jgi:hypothetical protein